MKYTLFFSRLRDLSPDRQRDYVNRSERLDERVSELYPGFVDKKTFVAEDGERLTVVRFLDEESQHAWKLDPVHREAQVEGRADFYEEYRIAVCDEVRCHEWHMDEGSPAIAGAESALRDGVGREMIEATKGGGKS